MNISSICSLPSHMTSFYRLTYQTWASKHNNWKELELLNLLKIY